MAFTIIIFVNGLYHYCQWPLPLLSMAFTIIIIVSGLYHYSPWPLPLSLLLMAFIIIVQERHRLNENLRFFS